MIFVPCRLRESLILLSANIRNGTQGTSGARSIQIEPPMASSALEASNRIDLTNTSRSSDDRYYTALNLYQADLGQGPSVLDSTNQNEHGYIAGDHLNEALINEEIGGRSNSTTRAVQVTNESAVYNLTESSTDSVYDHNSCYGGYRWVLNDDEIKKNIFDIEQGLVQVNLHKCSYTLGFEPIENVDLSRESLYSDEDYSNRYGTTEEQESAYCYVDCEIFDEVSEGRIRGIVGQRLL